jgi:prepilin-type N-terminal cleavage/methylation domain-containing protein
MMKKRAGFTLVELLVAIAIMAIVFGGLVALFGRTSVASQTGLNQEKAYEEARLTMEQLKTSLRYANKDEVKNQSKAAPAAGDTYGPASTLTYTGSAFDKHWDVSNGANVNYQVQVAWVSGSNNKQINVVITDTGTKKELKNITFPKNVANSAFKGDGTDFPVQYENFTTNDNNEASLYTVTLPVQYQLDGSAKIDTLTSKVTPTDYSNGKVTVVDKTPTGVFGVAENFVDILNKWEGVGTDTEHNMAAGWNKLTNEEKQTVLDVYNYVKTNYPNRISQKFKATANNNYNISGYDNDYLATLWYELTENYAIRGYYLSAFYNGSFPPVKLAAYGGTITVYAKPYTQFYHDSTTYWNYTRKDYWGYYPPRDVFIVGSQSSAAASDSAIYFIYDPGANQWYAAPRHKYYVGWNAYYAYDTIAYDDWKYSSWAALLNYIQQYWTKVAVVS